MSILQMSLAAAMIIGVVIVIRALAGKWLPRKTFLALWGIVLLRLLLPLDLPSQVSVFNLFSSPAPAAALPAGSAFVPQPVFDEIIFSQVNLDLESAYAVTRFQPQAQGTSPLGLIWTGGFIISAGFFIWMYVKWRGEFGVSLPVDNEFVRDWRRRVKLIRPLNVRMSDRIRAPLTYGVFRPVILLPKSTDWEKEEELKYVLTHELVHVKRFDALIKLLAAAALCVHWFNPLVWAMYFLLNRDMEISCDEKVISFFGEGAKSPYAMLLINMAGNRRLLSPESVSFSKYFIEERIGAIMKAKKASFAAVFMAVVLVLSSVAVFATSGITAAQGQVPAATVAEARRIMAEKGIELEVRGFVDHWNHQEVDFYTFELDGFLFVFSGIEDDRDSVPLVTLKSEINGLTLVEAFIGNLPLSNSLTAIAIEGPPLTEWPFMTVDWPPLTMAGLFIGSPVNPLNEVLTTFRPPSVFSDRFIRAFHGPFLRYANIQEPGHPFSSILIFVEPIDEAFYWLSQVYFAIYERLDPALVGSPNYIMRTVWQDNSPYGFTSLKYISPEAEIVVRVRFFDHLIDDPEEMLDWVRYLDIHNNLERYLTLLGK